MSFFFCNIDRKQFEAANPVLPLYPGKTNRWIIAFPSPVNDADVRATADFFFVFSGVKLDGVKGWRVDKWMPGVPGDLSGAASVVQGLPELPKDYVYAGVRFVYEGTLTELRPWPWRARGFVIRCPEDLIMGTVAVFPPVEPTPADIDAAGHGGSPLDAIREEIQAPITEVANTLNTGTKILIWGGAALLLFHLHGSLSSTRRIIP